MGKLQASPIVLNISSAICLLTVACSAQSISGRLINGTTGNPQSSVVTLLTGSGECGRTMTNDSGEFRITPDVTRCPQASAVLKVTLDGVDYFRPAVVGQFTSFKVYHSANHVSPITGSLSILQFQTIGTKLEVTELHALNNLSIPPITQTNPGNLLLSIPSGAEIEPAIISSPDGGTTKVPLVQVAGSAEQYKIDFPMKPGVTKYAIRYKASYDKSSFVFQRPIQYAIDRIGIIIPKSMHLRLISPNSRLLVANATNSQEQQLELRQLPSNATIAFALSGTGTLSHSFRPSQPGEPPASTLSASQTKVVSPSLLPASSIPMPQPSRRANYQYVAAVGILLLSGTLTWSLMRRRKAAISNAAHSFSTDAAFSLPPHESAKLQRREVPDTRR